MTTLAANSNRVFELGVEPVYGDVPMIADEIIYAGAACGESSSTGNARPLVAGDTFLGFATAKADNAGGAIGDVNVRVRQKGIVKLTIAGTLTDDHLNVAIYASDDNAFTTASTGNTQIGKLARFISATEGMVYFEAEALRSV